ncbi:carboxypeptidase regulatory-like domain-containing protein [Aeoliella sp. ICT_H6.2]|uniref:Carboxypeptidase regulatory-like domain-containing protein n=1 Tax=Aeoliella straminimaris TaxID=2954799 RepID=A0A9X2JK96_9BACT|nr:carboxypeptidase regulatory-like domain-containing protein [Aeoliella straminimaris]MCO6047878.1 carboxypeptidase regulatory-like domain-containing protein [Aeoliella straminimaris]
MLVSTILAWIVHCCVVSTVLMAIGGAATRVFRQPIDRLRVLQWTMATVVASLVLAAVPATWKLGISVPTIRQEPVARVPDADRMPVESNHAVGEEISEVSPPAQVAPNAGQMSAEVAVSPDFPLSNDRVAATIDYRAWAATSLVLIYFLGCVVYIVRVIVARIKLQNLYRHSDDVPPQTRREFDLIAGEEGRRVRLCNSRSILSPITWGTWRPVIALPQSLQEGDDSLALRFCLAHEWSHVRRGDSRTWSLTVCLQLFLYYHPLLWLLRRQLLLCMDRLADAEASGEADTPADYAAFLVQLARRQCAPHPKLALGVTDSRAALRSRVESLLHANVATRMLCPTWRSLVIGLAALAVSFATSAVRLEAEPVNANEALGNSESTEVAESPAEPDAAPAADIEVPEFWPMVSEAVSIAKPQIAEWLKGTMKEKEDGSLTYIGFVTDAVTDKPIAGATVSVHHKLSRDPKTGGWTTLEVTKHKTNPIGMYSFELPPEQVKESSLYIEVEADHPDFAAKGRSGYSHGMIRKNLELGELPFYTQIKLWPGEAIEGTVVSPNGEPVEGVEILMYAASDSSDSFPKGSFGKTQTDASGYFRIVPPTPGDGVLWITAEEYEPQAHRIRDRRGNWGTLNLVKGADIVGKVLDVNDEPVAKVKIEARRNGDGEEADEYLRSNAVANHIGRTTVSDETGEFRLPSLPDGDYTIETRADTDSYDPPPLEQVFLRQKFSVVDGQPMNITVRAVPHVEVHGTYLDSQGKPRSGHKVMLFGRLDGDFYFTQSSTPGKDGKFNIRLPHGLTETKLDLITNEHSALRWRKSADEPLQRGSNVKLGTVEDDIHGFEVVRYTAPILLVKAVNSEGDIVSDVTPIVTYVQQAGDGEEMTMFTTGSQVSFEAQGDGRHRSSQLLPDETISVIVQKEGFEATAQELSLKEGEEREIEIELTPVADGASAEGG